MRRVALLVFAVAADPLELCSAIDEAAFGLQALAGTCSQWCNDFHGCGQATNALKGTSCSCAGCNGCSSGAPAPAPVGPACRRYPEGLGAQTGKVLGDTLCFGGVDTGPTVFSGTATVQVVPATAPLLAGGCDRYGICVPDRTTGALEAAITEIFGAALEFGRKKNCKDFPGSCVADMPPEGECPTDGEGSGWHCPGPCVGNCGGEAGAAWLRAHNVYRCMHDVPGVTWSDHVFQHATDTFKNQNNMVHSNSFGVPAPAGPAAENLAIGFRASNERLHLVVDEWYGEVDFCNWDTSCGKSINTEQVGHFTAMIWNGAREIGCNVNHHDMAYCRYRASDAYPSCHMPNNGLEYHRNVFPAKRSKEECEKMVDACGPPDAWVDPDAGKSRSSAPTWCWICGSSSQIKYPHARPYPVLGSAQACCSSFLVRVTRVTVDGKELGDGRRLSAGAVAIEYEVSGEVDHSAVYAGIELPAFDDWVVDIFNKRILWARDEAADPDYQSYLVTDAKLTVPTPPEPTGTTGGSGGGSDAVTEGDDSGGGSGAVIAVVIILALHG